MTQTDRVLAALARAGASGITAVDFSLPDVIDGGPPITRIAARVEELRRDGHLVESGERRQKCVVYRLLPTETLHPALSSVPVWSAPTPATSGVSPDGLGGPVGADQTGTLFELPPASPYREDAA